MAQIREAGPYIWVTWLTKLLAGENSCEWAAWFRAQHEGWSWKKVPDTFDQTGWQLEHTSRINEHRQSWEDRGHTVFTENQNSFILRGKTAALGGRPDLIAKGSTGSTVIDIKTGQPTPSHSVQVMIYMYAIPRALTSYKGMTLDGRVVYQDHEIDIPHSAIDVSFVETLSHLIRRVAAQIPARRVPSPTECNYCNITTEDCPERAIATTPIEGLTEDF